MRQIFVHAFIGLLAAAALAACTPEVAQERVQHDQITADIEAARAQRGDALFPGALPYELPGQM